MSAMDATFMVEGFQGSAGHIPAGDEIGPIAVKLVTDGLVVFIVREPYNPQFCLTPKGFEQLAVAARALVDEANRAWAALGGAEELSKP